MGGQERECSGGPPPRGGRAGRAPPAGLAGTPLWMGTPRGGDHGRVGAGWETTVSLNEMSQEAGWGSNKKLPLASLCRVTCWRFSCA